MTARDTSVAALRSLDLSEGRRRVMLIFHRYPQETFTRAELAKRGGIPLQTCCGRVRELLDAGFLEELNARPCMVTGNSSHPLRVPSPKAAEQVPPMATRGDEDAEADSRKVEPATSVKTPTSASYPAPAAAPIERLIYDADDKPFYTAVGYGPGWPPDQDHLHRRRA